MNMVLPKNPSINHLLVAAPQLMLSIQFTNIDNNTAKSDRPHGI